MAKTRSFILIISAVLLYCATIPLNSLFKNTILQKEKDPDIIQNIFGGARAFVSDWAFMKAEEYHHRGLPFMGAAEYHQGESILMTQAQGGEAHEHHAEANSKLDLYSRIKSSVKVTSDSHLEPANDKEVLPWFYTEVAFNPHDIRGYVLGGFWLEKMGRYDESLKFLKEGEKQNPDSAQILTAIGKLCFRIGKSQEAVSYLEQARSLWLKGSPPNVITNEYIENDRRIAFDVLGYLYETSGQYEKAVETYSELLCFWQNPALEKKIIKLKDMLNTR